VSLSDSPSEKPEHLDLNALVLGGTIPRVILGNILALLSALFYAMYVILLKVRIKAEYRIDMQLFFGFVGLFNILACWPLGLILHLAGAEIFELPQTKQAVYAILINVRVYNYVCLQSY
jgi:solute carrier family 35 protein F5